MTDFAMSHQVLSTLRTACNRDGSPLLESGHVLGIGIGRSARSGVKARGDPCVKLYVDTVARDRSLADSFPRSFEFHSAPELPVEIEYMDQGWAPPLHGLDSLSRAVVERRRLPGALIKGGDSAAHYLFPVGTVALALPDHLLPGRSILISCNHVFACLNAGLVGDAILRPDYLEGGRWPRNAVGALMSFVPVNLTPNALNSVDVALAVVPAEAAAPFKVRGIGVISPQIADDVAPGDSVQKVGRSTGRTIGTISSVGAIVKINYRRLGFEDVTVIFEDQLVTNNMCAYGDSGSLLLNHAAQPVGLLFGGSTSHTFYNKLTNVLLKTGIRF
jgi:hypothetical protein